MPKRSPKTTHFVTIQGERYHIRRLGSRYNIFGPQGRVFNKYQSASVAGPRWEEITRTPWPHRSTAYEPGFRLQQLRIQNQAANNQPHAAVQPEHGELNTSEIIPLRETKRAVLFPPRNTIQFKPLLPALPRPKIDVKEQTQLIQQLRNNPHLLFETRTQQALRHEVEYHRPHAKWARSLLKLLARYERRQRARQRAAVDSATVLAKHIAWQEQRFSGQETSV